MIHGMLPLTRTLITFDVETTGVDPKTDRIIQIGLVTTQVDGEVFERVDLINPGIPIPPEAMAVHHITDEMVADAPPFSAFATALAYEFGQADVCGYSVNFDLAFLEAELRRCNIVLRHGKVIDVFKIYKRYHPLSLRQAMKDYLGEDAGDSAHDALFDARSTLRSLGKMIERHDDLPRNVHDLNALLEAPKPGFLDSEGKLAWKNNVAVITFGKHRDHPLSRIPVDYMRWILDGNFPRDFKLIVSEALCGRFPVKRETSEI